MEPNYVIHGFEAVKVTKTNSVFLFYLKRVMFVLSLFAVVWHYLLIKAFMYHADDFLWWKYLVLILTCVLFFIDRKHKEASPFEIRFFDDYMEVYRDKLYRNPLASRRQTDKFYYKDLASCTYAEVGERELTFRGRERKVWYRYRRNGSLPDKPTRDRTRDSSCALKTEFSDVDFRLQIEAHSPIQVEHTSGEKKGKWLSEYETEQTVCDGVSALGREAMASYLGIVGSGNKGRVGIYIIFGLFGFFFALYSLMKGIFLLFVGTVVVITLVYKATAPGSDNRKRAALALNVAASFVDMTYWTEERRSSVNGRASDIVTVTHHVRTNDISRIEYNALMQEFHLTGPTSYWFKEEPRGGHAVQMRMGPTEEKPRMYQDWVLCAGNRAADVSAMLGEMLAIPIEDVTKARGTASWIMRGAE